MTRAQKSSKWEVFYLNDHGEQQLQLIGTSMGFNIRNFLEKLRLADPEQTSFASF